MTQQQQSREFDVSHPSSIPPTSISNFKSKNDNNFIHRHKHRDRTGGGAGGALAPSSHFFG